MFQDSRNEALSDHNSTHNYTYFYDVPKKGAKAYTYVGQYSNHLKMDGNEEIRICLHLKI